MDISPYYIDARNSITQPDKMVFLSQYFRRGWMPALGPLGTAIVIYLRGACYHNRKSGETRDTVQIAQREIAAGCGCSVPTIKRELERNDALRRFVQISPEWERDGASGRVRQLENHYKVAMDDPLTEADEVRLKKMVEERIGQEQQARPRSGERPPKSIRLKEPLATIDSGLTACSKAALASVRTSLQKQGSNAVNTASSNAVKRTGKCKNLISTSEKVGLFVETNPIAHFELLRPIAQNESTSIQNELLSEESLLKTTKEQTFNVGKTVNYVAEEEKTIEDDSRTRKRRNALEEIGISECARIVEELKDWGSERRHRQLLSVCEQYSLLHLPGQALKATRQRLAQENKLGVLEKPGAYYQGILLKLLAAHQVFVPTLAEKIENDPAEVRRLVRESLGLGAD